jgi:hypothetical protein
LWERAITLWERAITLWERAMPAIHQTYEVKPCYPSDG